MTDSRVVFQLGNVGARCLGEVFDGAATGGGYDGILGMKVTMATFRIGCWRGFCSASTRVYVENFSSDLNW